MSAKRLSIRKIREVLRLKFEHGLTNWKIARSCSISRSTVSDYLLRARAAELSWPLPDALGDDGLERLLFPSSEAIRGSSPLPDWAEVHKSSSARG